MRDIFDYLGTDIAGFALTFSSLHLLANRRRSGFLVGAAASVAWAAFSYMTGSIPTLVSNFVFLGMQLRGWLKWGRHAPLP